MIHEYKTARSICGFIEFCAWTAVVVAAIVALVTISTASSGRVSALALAGLVPAFSLALVGFIVIVMVQMARATMDNSVTAQKSHIQAQKHHEELMRSFRQLAVSPAPLSDIAAKSNPTDIADSGAVRQTVPEKRATSTKSISGKTVDYKGVTITQEAPYRFVALGKTFNKVADAEVFIDFNGNAQQQEHVVKGNGSAENLQEGATHASTNIIKYRGYQIVPNGGGFLVNDKRFDTIGLAQNYISDLVDVAVTRE